LAVIPAPRSRLFEVEVEGHKVLWFPGPQMLAVEGHPGGDERLAPVTDLPAVAERLVGGLGDLGVRLPAEPVRPDRAGFGGIRRIDLTCDLERTAVVGTSILNCVAAVEPPGQIRSDVYRSKSGRAIETVAWRGGRRTVGRVYDKGIERGNGRHQRGELIRFEDQRRFDRAARPSVDAVVDGYARYLFTARFGALRAATRGVTVTTMHGAGQRIERLVREGELTPAQGEKLLGKVLFDSMGIEFGSRTTRWRRRKELRAHGLILADGVLQEGQELDLTGELDEVFDAAFSDATA
jgi:hypothetical protein